MSLFRRSLATLAAIGSLVLAGTVTGPASAAAPTIERVPVSSTIESVVLAGECGVPITITTEGFRIFRTFEDEQGRLRFVGTVNLSVTATSEFGTFRYRDVGADLEKVAPDGTLTLSIIGQLPFDFAGVLVLDLETDEVLKEPQLVRGAKQLEMACAVLAGS